MMFKHIGTKRWVARKQHICAHCGKPIEKGARYVALSVRIRHPSGKDVFGRLKIHSRPFPDGSSCELMWDNISGYQTFYPNHDEGEANFRDHLLKYLGKQ